MTRLRRRAVVPPVARGAGLVLGAVLLLGGCTRAAPAEQPALDGSRLLRDVGVLAADSMRGRRTGTPGNAMARRYLASELQRMGIEAVGGSYEHPFTFIGRRDSATYRGVNLLARIPGSRHPDRHIVVTAHYDHVGVGEPVDGDSIYNGADDNASGAAALLAIADHFRRDRPGATLVLAALDAEEMGLQGARAFLASGAVPVGSIVVNVNLDMVSRSERGELYAAGTARYPFLRAPLEAVAARAPVRLLFGHDRPVPTEADDWTLQSDHGVFHQAGIPFVYFGVEDHPGYHRPSDEVDSITPDFFVAAVRTVIDAVEALDEAVPELARQRSAGTR